jgi:Tfp pilus assembly protein PilN
MRAVNLLPREPKRSRKRLTVVGQLAIVSPLVVGALVAAGYLLASSKVNDRKATLAAVQAELAALPTPKPEPRPSPELALQRNQRITALSTALQGRLAWDRLLREISAVLPGDVWLTTLSAQSPPAPAPAVSPSSSTTTSTTTTTTTGAQATTPTPLPPATGPLSLSGYTYSPEGVARLLTRLAVIPELQDVKLLQSAQAAVAGRNVFSFSIQAGIRPQVTG